MKLRFLGTGGGRYVTATQKRKTAGILVETEETQVHVDPGPGALVETHEQGVAEDTDAVIVSHAHLDHANDAQAIIEMMTQAYEKPGAVFANETVLHGYGDLERFVSDYHQQLCSRVEQMEDQESYEFRDLNIETQEMFHKDPRTQGFILEDGEHRIGFWTDTEYSRELVEFYEDVDVLVVYCTRPKGKSVSSHTAVDDIPDIVEASEAGTVIVTHFGLAFLEEDLEEQEDWLDEEVDSKVIFAEDGMEFPGDKKLSSFVS